MSAMLTGEKADSVLWKRSFSRMTGEMWIDQKVSHTVV